MYRQYENPHMLEDMLAELKMELQNEKDEDTIINLQIEIAELNDRINFAWHDDEYDSQYNGGEFEY